MFGFFVEHRVEARRKRCLVAPRCRLRGVLNEALTAFVTTLDRYTLADLVLRPEDFGITAPTQDGGRPARRRTSQATP